MTALKKIMAKNFDGVIGLPTSSTLIITSPLRFCSTVVFLLNELFVTVHVDEIVNIDNNK